MVSETVELTEEQVNLLIKTLSEKCNDLQVLLSNSDGLGIETIHDIQLEHRDLNNIVRELQHYTNKREVD